jgi:hypothetical protein
MRRTLGRCWLAWRPPVQIASSLFKCSLCTKEPSSQATTQRGVLQTMLQTVTALASVLTYFAGDVTTMRSRSEKRNQPLGRIASQLHPRRRAAARRHAAVRVEDGRDVPPLRDRRPPGPRSRRRSPRRRLRGRLRRTRGGPHMRPRGNCNGGQRIRTSKGFRPPVFKTGALAIRPALPAPSNLARLAGLCASVYVRVPSSNKNGTDRCRFPEFSFDVLAEDLGTRVGLVPLR